LHVVAGSRVFGTARGRSGLIGGTARALWWR